METVVVTNNSPPPPSMRVLCVPSLCPRSLGSHTPPAHRATILPSLCPSYPHSAHRVSSPCSLSACSAPSASTYCARTVLSLPLPALLCSLTPPFLHPVHPPYLLCSQTVLLPPVHPSYLPPGLPPSCARKQWWCSDAFILLTLLSRSAHCALTLLNPPSPLTR